jgi:ribosomal-protein-alanine N-acetyltransferase
VQASIIPRNQASTRVAEKVGLRLEGLAQRYIQINGVWEDHNLYAVTSEEWLSRA